MTTLPHIDDVVIHALHAFWQTVLSQYPGAQSGDLSIERTVLLREAASEAVSEWIYNNVPPALTESE